MSIEWSRSVWFVTSVRSVIVPWPWSRTANSQHSHTRYLSNSHWSLLSLLALLALLAWLCRHRYIFLQSPKSMQRVVTHANQRTNTLTHIYTYIHIHTYIYIYVYVHPGIFAHPLMALRVDMCVYVYVCVVFGYSSVSTVKSLTVKYYSGGCVW